MKNSNADVNTFKILVHNLHFLKNFNFASIYFLQDLFPATIKLLPLLIHVLKKCSSNRNRYPYFTL